MSKSRRKLVVNVNPQTYFHLIEKSELYNVSVGQIIDKLVRDHCIRRKHYLRNKSNSDR